MPRDIQPPETLPGDEAYQTTAEKRAPLQTGIIKLPLMLQAREFHVYNRLQRMWEKVPYDDIIEGQIFRVMENGRVLKFGGHKYLSYIDYAYRNSEGDLEVKVIGRKMTF